ncbi:MAG: DUF3494 domain-containing protein [Geobacteraceae bacterium]|nr:DUF3494 domain-containing protein [Geobacteraceae bacterium]
MKNRITTKTNIFDRLTVRFSAIALSAALLSAAPFNTAYAAAPALGTAGSYAVLAGPAVTLTDSSITGDVGSGLPFSIITQTNSTVSGTLHQGDAGAVTAYADFLNSYDALAAEPCNVTLTGTLSGQVLAPNVYCFDAAATLTGQLTLDGPSNGIWIFKVGSLGTGALTGTNFSVVMAGGGQPCNVYWWVAEAATMTTSNFQGNILAGMDSTFTGGSLIGRDLAKAATTLTGTTVSACGAGPVLPPPVDPGKDDCKNHDHGHDKDHDHEKDHDNDHNKDHKHGHDKDNDKDHNKK